MTITYKNDDSFFTMVIPTRCYYGHWLFFKWFHQVSQANFRAIRDLEIEQDRYTLKEIDEIYPDIKSIGVVMNPWARAWHSYNVIIDPEAPAGTVEFIKNRYPGIDLSNFTSYVTSLVKCMPDPKYGHALPPTTPQAHWLGYQTDNGYKEVDYVLRVESLNEDFKKIQEYFCTEHPLGIPDINLDYHEHYTDETREIVATTFAEDIERYSYKF